MSILVFAVKTRYGRLSEELTFANSTKERRRDGYERDADIGHVQTRTRAPIDICSK